MLENTVFHSVANQSLETTFRVVFSRVLKKIHICFDFTYYYPMQQDKKKNLVPCVNPVRSEPKPIMTCLHTFSCPLHRLLYIYLRQVLIGSLDCLCSLCMTGQSECFALSVKAVNWKPLYLYIVITIIHIPANRGHQHPDSVYWGVCWQSSAATVKRDKSMNKILSMHCNGQ